MVRLSKSACIKAIKPVKDASRSHAIGYYPSDQRTPTREPSGSRTSSAQTPSQLAAGIKLGLPNLNTLDKQVLFDQRLNSQSTNIGKLSIKIDVVNEDQKKMDQRLGHRMFQIEHRMNGLEDALNDFKVEVKAEMQGMEARIIAAVCGYQQAPQIPIQANRQMQAAPAPQPASAPARQKLNVKDVQLMAQWLQEHSDLMVRNFGDLAISHFVAK